MMHDQPNNPEYCQGIYEAAKAVIKHYRDISREEDVYYQRKARELMLNLERALEGKP